MEKEAYNFQTTWEEVGELKERVTALLRKVEIRIDKLSEVKKAMEVLDGIMANINNGANNGRDRDKKIFLLDKSTFPDALTFSESDLEEKVVSGNYFDDDIIKIDANGYNSVREAIKNEWCNLTSEDDLEDVLKDWYVIPFGF